MTTRTLIDAAHAAGARLRPRIWVEHLDRLSDDLRAGLRAREVEVLRVLLGCDPARIAALAAVLLTEHGNNPAVRITDRAKALAYFTARATAELSAGAVADSNVKELRR